MDLQSRCVFGVLNTEVRRLGSEVRSLKSEVPGLTDPIDVQNAFEQSQGANGDQWVRGQWSLANVVW